MQPDSSSKLLVGIRLHLTDGSVHSFTQSNDIAARERWAGLDPNRVFTGARIVVGSEHSKAVFVSTEIVRIDFLHDSLQFGCFPVGFSDVMELSEEEFRHRTHLDQPSLMAKREEQSSAGDLLVSFVRLHMRGSRPLFAAIQIPVKLPAESQSFMQFMLSKAAALIRLRGGGIGVLNLANLAGYAVYPGLAQIPADAWLGEPVQTYTDENC